MILEIERLWGKSPGWFSTLEERERTRLIAWYRVHCDPKGGHR